MNNNQIFHSNPLNTLSSMVNRTTREKTVHALFTNLDITELANADDSITELLEAGLPAITSIPNPSDVAHKLYPLNDFFAELDGKQCALMYIYFYNLSVISSGGGGFTAQQINDAIKNSALAEQHSYAFNQTVIRNSHTVSFQPNWFRPKLVINGNIDYFDVDETSGIYPLASPSGVNKSEFAIGLNLPHVQDGGQKALAVYDDVISVDVYASCYQAIKIDSSTVYQKYPIICEAKFIVAD